MFHARYVVLSCSARLADSIRRRLKTNSVQGKNKRGEMRSVNRPRNFSVYGRNRHTLFRTLATVYTPQHSLEMHRNDSVPTGLPIYFMRAIIAKLCIN